MNDQIVGRSSSFARCDVDALKAACPMPVLLHKLGLGAHAKQSCRSPLREDRNPSWGIFHRNGLWAFKDFATGDSGDEITLIARLNGWDCQRDFRQIVELYGGLAGIALPGGVHRPQVAARGDTRQFGPGTSDQLRRLAALRGIGIEGLIWAQKRGVLSFGVWHALEVFVITDQTGRIVELRRLDGQFFPKVGDLQERKAHTCRGGQKNWPVGLLEAKDFPCFALTEGGPDFLGAHFLALWEQASHYASTDVRCAPVTMLSASPRIADDALPHFRGKIVRIFVHHDANGAGAQAARRWTEQLQDAGAARVDTLCFEQVSEVARKPVKDLNDFLKLRDSQLLFFYPALQRILPDRAAITPQEGTQPGYRPEENCENTDAVSKEAAQVAGEQPLPKA